MEKPNKNESKYPPNYNPIQANDNSRRIKVFFIILIVGGIIWLTKYILGY